MKPTEWVIRPGQWNDGMPPSSESFSVWCDDQIIVTRVYGRDEYERSANASLIVSAPRLLRLVTEQQKEIERLKSIIEKQKHEKEKRPINLRRHDDSPF